MIYYASAVGSVVLALLKETTTWHVHSLFKKGFNLINQNDVIIFIGTNENGSFPFGISVDEQTKKKMMSHIQRNDEFCVNQLKLQHAKFSIDINTTIIEPRQNFHDADVESLRMSLLAYDFSNYADSDFSLSRMTALKRSLSDANETVLPQLEFLVGRGNGLTPTGDDILVGLLYSHFIQPFIAPVHLQTIKTVMAQERTTIISKNFINLALQGIFSSRISQFNDTVSDEAIQALIEVGSSSGKDILYGIYIGLIKGVNK
ncbi:DUF2877 domain-containing protein [Staphylococcus pseudintermedius]|uniref:DUF2877 domain-containing protein n=1 Tax=Staphylococcus pseudintermedius TaxID=283734 RepID=UPI0018E0D4E9|nr:DUF2877 domain-containing protein [Staphylococcus pseudintermedius]EGQ0309650.1 DUF2877 domain-containing protein [Staphylococcus pseudintermedius]EGQ0315816.1 DUF2877 domain-containing protein [Staphylococcus pseudintermedius]EGQ0362103.1 DUF2877 domain-containing protein [Staphylococcus pseudintermedius]EGQ0397586.1 DUF2877 domain-containing protein [Staphylococcus pseudintermedius]EGQ1282190.1 DUF2877 domain-containing protein [Staphylococcus pseudintermedius]